MTMPIGKLQILSKLSEEDKVIVCKALEQYKNYQWGTNEKDNNEAIQEGWIVKSSYNMNGKNISFTTNAQRTNTTVIVN